MTPDTTTHTPLSNEVQATPCVSLIDLCKSLFSDEPWEETVCGCRFRRNNCVVKVFDRQKHGFMVEAVDVAVAGIYKPVVFSRELIVPKGAGVDPEPWLRETIQLAQHEVQKQRV